MTVRVFRETDTEKEQTVSDSAQYTSLSLLWRIQHTKEPDNSLTCCIHVGKGPVVNAML